MLEDRLRTQSLDSIKEREGRSRSSQPLFEKTIGSRMSGATDLSPAFSFARASAAKHFILAAVGTVLGCTRGEEALV